MSNKLVPEKSHFHSHSSHLRGLAPSSLFIVEEEVIFLGNNSGI